MSFYYSVIMDDRIALLADGGEFCENGILIDVKSKVYQSSKHPIAFTGCGNAAVVEYVTRSIRFASDFVGSFEEVVAIAQKVIKTLGEEQHIPDEGHFEMLMAGWGEDGPMNLIISSLPLMLPGAPEPMPPFQIYNAGTDIGGGATIPIEQAMAELAESGITAEKIQAAGRDALEEYGADLMEVMRCHAGFDPSGAVKGKFVGIGGFAELTTIRPDGITQKILREWPDQIGDVIRPGALGSSRAS